MGRIVIKPRSLLPATIVCVGDSITLGQNTADPGGTTSYPYYLAQQLGYAYGPGSGTRVINRGVSSLGSRDLADMDYLLKPGAANHLVLMIGVNDIVSNFDAYGLLARVLAYVNARQAAGWIVTVCTITVIGPATGPQNAVSTTWSQLVRANFARVVDHAPDPHIGHDATTPSAWVTGDQTHLTVLGNQLSASQVYDFISTRLNGPGPSIQPQYGLPLSSDLTAWFRDWHSISPTDLSVNNTHSLVDVHDFQNYLGQNGFTFGPPHVKITKLDSALNGYSAMSFPGAAIDNSAYFVSGLTLDQFVAANAALVQIVFRATSIDTNTTNKEDNVALLNNGQNNFGVGLRNTGSGYKIFGYIYDTGIKYTPEVDISLTTWYVASLRLTGGKLGLQINRTGTWQEVSCGNISRLDANLRIGSAYDLAHPFHGEMAELSFRNAYSDATLATAHAYFGARYAL